MMEMVFGRTTSIAGDLDSMLLEVRCPSCKRFMAITIQELRTGGAVPCPNCEAWLPLWDLEGIFQELYDMAVGADGWISGAGKGAR